MLKSFNTHKLSTMVLPMMATSSPETGLEEGGGSRMRRGKGGGGLRVEGNGEEKRSVT